MLINYFDEISKYDEYINFDNVSIEMIWIEFIRKYQDKLNFKKLINFKFGKV